jgi:hypothetical protein
MANFTPIKEFATKGLITPKSIDLVERYIIIYLKIKEMNQNLLLDVYGSLLNELENSIKKPIDDKFDHFNVKQSFTNITKVISEIEKTTVAHRELVQFVKELDELYIEIVKVTGIKNRSKQDIEDIIQRLCLYVKSRKEFDLPDSKLKNLSKKRLEHLIKLIELDFDFDKEVTKLFSFNE